MPPKRAASARKKNTCEAGDLLKIESDPEFKTAFAGLGGKISADAFLNAYAMLFGVEGFRRIGTLVEDPFMKAFFGDAKFSQIVNDGNVVRNVTMRLGDFHERIMGSLEGFQLLCLGHETGCDVLSTNGKVVIEVKNKYNTMNSSAEKAVKQKLATQAALGRMAILCQVISQKESYKMPDEDIYVLNGNDMYASMTGIPDFIDKLVNAVAVTSSVARRLKIFPHASCIPAPVSAPPARTVATNTRMGQAMKTIASLAPGTSVTQSYISSLVDGTAPKARATSPRAPARTPRATSPRAPAASSPAAPTAASIRRSASRKPATKARRSSSLSSSPRVVRRSGSPIARGSRSPARKAMRGSPARSAS